MIEVLVRLGDEEPQREMIVRAGNIIDALCVAEEHSLGGKVRLVFPIDAGRFFVGETAKVVELEGWK